MLLKAVNSDPLDFPAPAVGCRRLVCASLGEPLSSSSTLILPWLSLPSAACPT